MHATPLQRNRNLWKLCVVPTQASRGLVVLDLSAENIMVDAEGVVRLIDFSNAVEQNTVMKNFYGTPPFVHRQVHLVPQHWKAKAQIDLVGLTFVFASLWQSLDQEIHYCKIPYSEGSSMHQRLLKDRHEKTKAIIQEYRNGPSRAEQFLWMDDALNQIRCTMQTRGMVSVTSSVAFAETAVCAQRPTNPVTLSTAHATWVEDAATGIVYPLRTLRSDAPFPSLPSTSAYKKRCCKVGRSFVCQGMRERFSNHSLQ